VGALGEIPLIPLYGGNRQGVQGEKKLPGMRGGTAEDLAYLFLKVRKGESVLKALEGPAVESYGRPISAKSAPASVPWRNDGVGNPWFRPVRVNIIIYNTLL